MYGAQFRVFGIHQHFAGQNLRIPIHLLHIVNRPGNHPRIVQQFQPVLRVLGGESLLQQRGQLFLPCLPVPWRAETLVFHQVFPADGAAELLPCRLGCGPQVQVAVPGPKGLVRGGDPVRRTQWAGNLPFGEVHRGFPYRVGHSRLHQRGIHHLSLAGLQGIDVGRHDSIGSEQAGGQVGNRNSHFRRGRVGVPRNAHQAAYPLRHKVESAPVAGRAGAAEPGNRAVDQARLDGRQLCIT